MIDNSEFSAFVDDISSAKKLDEIAQSANFDDFVTNEHSVKDHVVSLVKALAKRGIQRWSDRNETPGSVVDSIQLHSSFETWNLESSQVLNSQRSRIHFIFISSQESEL